MLSDTSQVRFSKLLIATGCSIAGDRSGFENRQKAFYLHGIPQNIPPEISRCKLETTILVGKSIFDKMDPKEFLHMAMEVPPDTDVELAVKVRGH